MPGVTTYQLVLKGADPDRTDTDHLIKWVNAPTEEAARRYAEALGWKVAEVETIETPGGGPYLPIDGVDAEVDEEGRRTEH